MSNSRYTGPKAEDTMEERREFVSMIKEKVFDQDDLDEIVEELFKEVFGDSEYGYIMDDSARQRAGHQSTTKQERAEISRRLQRELTKRIEKKNEEEVVTTKAGPKRKFRWDRVAAVAVAATVAATVGIKWIKRYIGGRTGDTRDKDFIQVESSGTDVTTTVPVESPVSSYDSTTDTSTNTSTSDVETSQYDASEHETDRISYVVDFIDYYNPSMREHIMQMLDEGMIDGLALEFARGGASDNPFKLTTFNDDEINNELKDYIDSGKLELVHEYGGEPIEWFESYVEKAPVTIPYFYTNALNKEEAEIEATCIEATYNKMKKDMPEYDFQNRMSPIAIDIENCGHERGSYGDIQEHQEAMKERTKIVLYLIDLLRERGVIDERGVIIYGDLNRMNDKSDADWDGLFQGLKDRNINTVKWGTRAVAETFNNPYDDIPDVEFDNVYSFRDALMNTSTNITYMKNNYEHLIPLLSDIAMQQIHLNQHIVTNTYGENYDVNITTKNTLDAIVSGNHIDYNKGFIDRIQDVRMQEVRKDLQESNSQVEEYIQEDYMNNNINHDTDDEDR